MPRRVQGYLGADCSQESSALQFGVSAIRGESAFEYDYFQLPNVTSGMLSHSVEVRFEASWSSSNYGAWAAAKPELLLLKVTSDSLSISAAWSLLSCDPSQGSMSLATVLMLCSRICIGDTSKSKPPIR